MTRNSEVAANIHSARVYLREARARRARSPWFADMLLLWAANARRRAMSAKASAAPAQGDLFGGRP